MTEANGPFDSALFEPPTKPWHFADRVRYNLEVFRHSHPGIEAWSLEAVAMAWNSFLSDSVPRGSSTIPPAGHSQRFYIWLCEKLSVSPRVYIPSDRPAVPPRVRPPSRAYRPFSEARSFTHRLQLRCSEDWWMWCAGARPDLPARPFSIPVDPKREYVQRWRGWPDWLGTNDSPAAQAAADWSVQFERVCGRRPEILQLTPQIRTLDGPGQEAVTWSIESLIKATRRLAGQPSHDEQ